MRFDIITLFPEMFPGPLGASMIARAHTKKKVEIKVHNLRDFTKNPWGKVDGPPAGGGPGLVLACQPLWDAILKIKGRSKKDIPVVHFSPRGEDLRQETVEAFSKKYSRCILICGHYEGMDERIIQTHVTHEICMGPYVLTGGEIPAMAFVDAVGRLLPGVLGNSESLKGESFGVGARSKKAHPQYTAPAEYKGLCIPEVLLSGNHARIHSWRKEQEK